MLIQRSIVATTTHISLLVWRSGVGLGPIGTGDPETKSTECDDTVAARRRGSHEPSVIRTELCSEQSMERLSAVQRRYLDWSRSPYCTDSWLIASHQPVGKPRQPPVQVASSSRANYRSNSDRPVAISSHMNELFTWARSCADTAACSPAVMGTDFRPLRKKNTLHRG